MRSHPSERDMAKKWFISTIDARDLPVDHVLASGAVVWQRSSQGVVEVLMVHRKRYDDWSLPKGKIDPVESPIMTALREVLEETGFKVRLGKFLQRVQYPLSQSRQKVVFYWAAQSVGGKFRPNGEVDRISWMTVEDACALTTYDTDRQVLRRFSKIDLEWQQLVLVRHGRAGTRVPGVEDVLRPLDTLGRQQATCLAEAARAYGVTELYSADRVRCEQTVLPAAHLLNVPVFVERRLSDEASLVHSDDTVEWWSYLCERVVQGTVPLVCSQGGTIPLLLESSPHLGGISFPIPWCKKGGMWVLFVDREATIQAADYLPTALPVR